MRPSGGNDDGFLLALDAAGRRMLETMRDDRRQCGEGPCAIK